MSEPLPDNAPHFELPPSVIASGPFTLDGVLFTPEPARSMEHATRDGAHLGDVLCDLESYWFARKRDAAGELSDWKHMRCVHEARAFLVSRIRQ